MISKLRIWRATPVLGTVKAPSFFVESTEDDLTNARLEADKLARLKTRLSEFKNCKIQLEKIKARKDEYGRYWKYHQ